MAIYVPRQHRIGTVMRYRGELVSLCYYTWDQGPQTKARVGFGEDHRFCDLYDDVLYSELEDV